MQLILIYLIYVHMFIGNNFCYRAIQTLNQNAPPKNINAPFFRSSPQGKPLYTRWVKIELTARRRPFTIINLIAQSDYDTRHDPAAFPQGCFDWMYSQARTFNQKIALISFVQFSKITSSLRSDVIFTEITSSLRSDIISKHPWESDRIIPGIVIRLGD